MRVYERGLDPLLLVAVRRSDADAGLLRVVKKFAAAAPTAAATHSTAPPHSPGTNHTSPTSLAAGPQVAEAVGAARGTRTGARTRSEPRIGACWVMKGLVGVIVGAR